MAASKKNGTESITRCRSQVFDYLTIWFSSPFGVALGHLVQRNRLDLARLAGGAEGLEARQADLLGGFARRFQVVARVELVRMLGR